MTPGVSGSPEAELVELFLASFEPDQLRSFIRMHYPDDVHALPFGGSGFQLADEAVQVLKRRSLVDALLFRRMVATRPRRHTEILACARGWGLAEADVPPPTAEALAGERALRANLRIGPGVELSGYRLVRQLGAGGYGSVWLGEAPQGGSVALKILRGDLGHDTRLRARFLRGAERMREIRHPSLVAVFDIHDGASGECFYAMEYVDGHGLDHLCKAGGLPAHNALTIVAGIAGALAACHAGGVIHCDVKPQNIVVDRRGVPHLADFDFVALVDSIIHSATAPTGTFGFMAPELVAGRSVTPRADIYGLGVTAIFALMGRSFVPGGDLPAQIRGIPCSAAVRQVLLHATAQGPEDRFPSMEAFLAELERARAGGTAHHARRGPGRLLTGLLAGAWGAVALSDAVVRDADPDRLATMLARAPAGCPEGMTGIAGGELPLTDGGTAELHAFCLDTHEVTMAQYAACVAERGCTPLPETVTQEVQYSRFCNHANDDTRRRHPVNCISWLAARSFCERRGEGIRLPTQQEFEWATRGGTLAREHPWPLTHDGVDYDGTEYPSARLVNGCGLECKRGFGDLWKPRWEVMYDEDDGHPQTAEVGSFPPAPLGPYDLVGNVMEWTSTRSGDRYILKGGSWYHTDASKLRSTGQSIYPPTVRLNYFGFRCARDADSPPR